MVSRCSAEPRKVSEVPFFIVGCPRSGTTLLQTLIDAHPRLAVPPESHFFDHFAGLAPAYGDLRRPGLLRRFVRDVLSDQRIQRWRLGVSVEEFCRDCPGGSVRDVCTHLFGLYARREGKARWGDKTPSHALCLPGIKSVFPEAKVVHLVRDGRDVAVSLRRVFFGPNRVDRIAEVWVEYLAAFDTFRRQSGPDEWLEVRYEDLVLDPEEQTGRVLRFLDESPELDATAVPDTALRRRYARLDGGLHGSLAGPISSARIGSFRHRLSSREIAVFESIAGGALERYGYGRTTAGTVRLRPYERVSWFVTDNCLRAWRKLGHLEYVVDRLQDRSRRLLRGGLAGGREA